MRKIAFPALIALALALPAGASAASVNCQAPAGTSGIDQYCEVLPGAGGSGGTHHKKKTKHVSESTTQKLQRSGDDGAAILQLTESSGSAAAESTTTATPTKKHKTTHKKKSSATTPSSSSTAQTPTKTTAQAKSEGPSPGNDPFTAVGNSFSVGSGVSDGFVWVLVGIGLIFVAMGWLSYRNRSRESGAS